MKVAVPVVNDDRINEHFGKSESFNLYSVDNNKITSVKTIPSFQGSGCKSGIASVLADEGVTVVLTAGIGGGSTSKLKKAGIEIIAGCMGSPLENVELFIKGELKDSGSTCHKHHHHDHEHDHNHVTQISGDELRIKK
jgi:predicted Fe-Mo cluster-binding NifX family protein